jgi:hypothetical protein
MTNNAFSMIYHSLFHTVMTYEIIFWGNSYHSIKDLRMQKRTIRIIMGCGNRKSCRNLFKKLNILQLMSQWLLCLLIFVTNKRDHFFINSEIRSISTRYGSNLHLPGGNLNIYQKRVYYSGIKIFSRLCRDIRTCFDNSGAFKRAVKRFL